MKIQFLKEICILSGEWNSHFRVFFSCRKRKLDFMVLLYAIFSSIHQKIFLETRNFIFEVKYLHKYVQRCSFLLKLQASCVRAVQNFFCSKLLQIFNKGIRHLFLSALLVAASTLWLKKIQMNSTKNKSINQN